MGNNSRRSCLYNFYVGNKVSRGYVEAYTSPPRRIEFSVSLLVITLIISFQFAIVEVIVTSIQDGFPRAVKKYLICHELLVLVVCFASFLLGLPLVTQVWKASLKFSFSLLTSIFCTHTTNCKHDQLNYIDHFADLLYVLFAGWYIFVPNNRLLHYYLVGDLHCFFRSDSSVLDVWW